MGRHPLNPGCTANDYEIRANDTLILHMSLRGGPSASPNARNDLPAVRGLETTAVSLAVQELASRTLVQGKDEANRAFRQRGREHKKYTQTYFFPRAGNTITASCPG